MFNSLSSAGFFQTNWIALAIFVIVLAVFNSYFISNFKLFSLLEEENWIDLTTYLEDRIYKKKQVRKSRIKMLLNAYLLTSNQEGTRKLEKFLAHKHQHMIDFFSLHFGIPYLLQNDPFEAEKFYSKMLAGSRVRYKNWLRWNYGLSLIQQNQYESGKNELMQLLTEDKDPILLLLSLYILKSYIKSYPDIASQIITGVEKLKNDYNILTWRKMVENQKSNVQVLVLSKIVNQASDWLFSDAHLKENDTPAEQSELVH